MGVEYLLSLVNDEVGEGKKVFVGGYSQGGVIALLTTLIGGGKVDGLAVVKGWVARNEIIRQVCHFPLGFQGYSMQTADCRNQKMGIRPSQSSGQRGGRTM